MEADHICIVVSRRLPYQVFAFSCLQQRLLSIEEPLSKNLKIQPGDWIIVKSLTNLIINEFQQTNSQCEAYATFDGTVRLNLSVIFPSLELGGASHHGWGWSPKIGWIQCAEGVERWIHVGSKSIFSAWVEWREKWQSWCIEPQKLIEDHKTSYQELIRNAPWRLDKATTQHASTYREQCINSKNVNDIRRLHWRECTDEEKWLSVQKPNSLSKECKLNLEDSWSFPCLKNGVSSKIEWNRAIVMKECLGRFFVYTEHGPAIVSEGTQDISDTSHLPISLGTFLLVSLSSSTIMCGGRIEIKIDFYKVVEPFFETSLTCINDKLELRVVCEVLFLGDQEIIDNEVISFGTNEFFGKCYICNAFDNKKLEKSFRGRLQAVICMIQHPLIVTQFIFKILDFRILEEFRFNSKTIRTSIGFIFIGLPSFRIWSKDFNHDLILPKKYLNGEIRESWIGKWVRFSYREVGCKYEVCMVLEVLKLPLHPVRIKSGIPEVRCIYRGQRDLQQRAVLFSPDLSQLIYDRNCIIHTAEYGNYDLWVVRENGRNMSWKISDFESESIPILPFSNKSTNENCNTITMDELSVIVKTVLQSTDVKDSLARIDYFLLNDLTKMIK